LKRLVLLQLNLKVYHHSCRNNGNKPGEEIITK
jgi:hypothetical protein